MHDAAFNFVSMILGKLPPRKAVVEYGGRYINGTVRPLFTAAEKYVSIDTAAGDGVDEVANAVGYTPPFVPDTVVCCEVLEHTPDWREVVQSASDCLVDGGYFIATCATEPRAPHSGVDGGPIRAGEYYSNIDPIELDMLMMELFTDHKLVRYEPGGDLYVVGYVK